MQTKFSKAKLFSIQVFFILLLVSCSNTTQLFEQDYRKFGLEKDCLPLASELHENIKFQGSIWFEEDSILHSGKFGLQWIGSSLQDTGTLPINPIYMIVSPDGKEALFDGYEVGVDVLDSQIYVLKNHEYQKTKTKWFNYSPILKDANTLLGTSWNIEKRTTTVITTDLSTGTVQENAVRDSSMSTEPAPKIASNGVLTYIWYQNYEGPRLVVYDTKTNTEIARYKDVLYQLRPFWYGYLLNPQGTHILSISSLSGEGYDGAQQELFGVEIGKEPVQITNFHSKYPYTRIYDINFGGQRWSPDNRWIVLNVLPSETRQIDSSVNPSWLFLIDLEKNIGYQICQQINPKDQHSITWSPDSKYFALSINDKIWVVEPRTLESRLLIEKPNIPLQILGWTIP